MKKFFTFFAAVLMASSMMASNITYHLTGCTHKGENPTEFGGDEELYFIPEDGYTLTDWEVTVKYGETVLGNNDSENPNGYVVVMPGYLNIMWFGTVTEDVDVTIVCQTAAPIVLETLTATVDELGIHVTSSDQNLKWGWSIAKVSEYADSLAIDAIVTYDFVSMNQSHGSFAYESLGGYFMNGWVQVGNHDLLFTETYVSNSIPENEESYFYAVGVANVDGNIARGSNVAIVKFTYVPAPTALENTAAGVKAVKTIENGQMVIIREGKRYNAVGAEL